MIQFLTVSHSGITCRTCFVYLLVRDFGPFHLYLNNETIDTTLILFKDYIRHTTEDYRAFIAASTLRCSFGSLFEIRNRHCKYVKHKFQVRWRSCS